MSYKSIQNKANGRRNDLASPRSLETRPAAMRKLCHKSNLAHWARDAVKADGSAEIC